MLKLFSALAVAVLVLVAAPSAQAAPAVGLMSLKSTQSVVEHRLFALPSARRPLSLLASPRLLGSPPLLSSPRLLARSSASAVLSLLRACSSALRLVVRARNDKCQLHALKSPAATLGFIWPQS